VEGLDDGDDTFVLLLTDGGEGDQDGVVNGEITDPGSVGVSGTPPIPTVSEWGMILLAFILAGIGLGRMRKRTAGTLLF
jgi:large repetitive protein